MKNSNDKTTHVGLGFTSALTLLFIGLKLTGYIDWSWWWVLAPEWIVFALFGLGLIIVFLIEIFKAVFKGDK